MKFKTLYYRGFLKSCNYSCTYCPFSKNKISKTELKKDEECLIKFVDKAKNITESIFFIPYGEAMIHSYYWKALRDLSLIENINSIGIQTNLGFDLIKFNKFFKESGMKSKIYFWCSYHPYEISMERFIENLKLLEGYNFTVGMVAEPNNMEIIEKMRNELAPNIYLWLNKMDGLKRNYTFSEIDKFTNIDPYFQNELKIIRTDFENCSGGKENCFIDYKGDLKNCILDKKVFGNLYEEKSEIIECNKKRCSCFLSYSNRNDIETYTNKFRIPKYRAKKIFIYDMDGTILDKAGKVKDDVFEKIKLESEEGLVFLNTSNSYKNAKIRCRKIWKYLSGGAFSCGSHIKYGDYERFLFIKDKVELNGFKTFHNNELIKITLPRNKNFSFNHEDLRITLDDRLIYITNKNAGKLNGFKNLVRLTNPLYIETFGNGLADKDWTNK